MNEIISSRDRELAAVKHRLTQLQGAMLKTENEKLVLEKRTSEQISQLRSQLAEREEEFQYSTKSPQGNDREEELLRRIEEDDVRIAALERLVGETTETTTMQEKLKKVERRLKDELDRVRQIDADRSKLQREKRLIVEELRSARQQLLSQTEKLQRIGLVLLVNLYTLALTSLTGRGPCN